MPSNNKTIAKNTVFLYFRMLFTMAVALYTSRVVLQVLGVDDFGIYQTVGGVVALLSFINGALSTGSSRFLTFELGTGDFEKLKRTFSSVLIIHFFLALVILLIAETIGLWFVYNKLVIGPERMEAAVFAYHFSVLTAFFTITQVPYNASIISHEKMNIYAYMSILEVSLKLGIVYLLKTGSFDKLKLYAILLCVIQVGIALFYRLLCVKKFEETKFHLSFDKEIVKSVLGYSSWNLFANTAFAVTTQGLTVLINMFFNPSVVAARAIANQVNMAAHQFINNFRTAANPQIVKRYAAKDFEGSKSLLLSSTQFAFYLMLGLGMPMFFLAEPLLRLWLGIVPEYSVVFLQYALVTSLFQVFDSSFYMALYAKGRIRENALLSPTILFLGFPIMYVLFKLGYSPISSAIVSLICYALIGLIVKPLLIIKIANYTVKDVVGVFIPCFVVFLVSTSLSMVGVYLVKMQLPSDVLKFILETVVCVFSVGASVWFLGLDKNMKNKIKCVLKNKCKQLMPK